MISKCSKAESNKNNNCMPVLLVGPHLKGQPVPGKIILGLKFESQQLFVEPGINKIYCQVRERLGSKGVAEGYNMGKIICSHMD